MFYFSLSTSKAHHTQSRRTPRKIDSYNDKIRSGEAEQWHLEDFFKELIKDPDSQAYIIAYGGREDNPGKAHRYAQRAKNYMVEARGIVPSRIVTMDGGRREEFIVELWLVPNGSPSPKPTPTVTSKDDLGDNLLFDGFVVGCEGFSCSYEDDAAHLDGFAAALKKEPTAWGCIIAYAQSGDDRLGQDWDSPGTGQKIARSQRTYLIKKHGLAQSRLSAIDGGYSWRGVELWVMRPKARFDKGPFLYSGRLKASGKGALKSSDDAKRGLCCKACIRGQTDRYILRDEQIPIRRKGKG